MTMHIQTYRILDVGHIGYSLLTETTPTVFDVLDLFRVRKNVRLGDSGNRAHTFTGKNRVGYIDLESPLS